MQTEKEQATLIHIMYICTILCILYVFFRYLIYAMMPFLLGFLIAFMLRPAIRRTILIFHLPHKLVSVFYLIVFYGTIGISITILSVKGFQFLQSFIGDVPSLYQTHIEPAIYSFLWQIQKTLADIDPATLRSIQNLFIQMNDSFQSFTLSFSTFLISTISTIASSLPSIMLSFFITILSSIFFALDFPNISSFIIRQFSKEKQTTIYIIRELCSETILQYIFAYAKLMIITFLELSIGLSYLGVEGAITISFIISFFDILPILGTGTILFPWIIISFFNHQKKLAIGLLILHFIINLIRQILEPKIVGKQMGLHPILMLACMFFGVKLFGFLGIFLTPILLQILQKLNHMNILHLYKE